MPKVKVIRSFSDSVHGSFNEGDVVDLPAGVDWEQAGFVVLLLAAEVETASIAPPERAVKKTANPRQPRSKK